MSKKKETKIRRPRTEAEERDLILKIRRMIPEFKCVVGCTDCCGPITFSKWEWDQVPNKLRATSINCPYAQFGGCQIYEHRPIVCRLFGTVESLKCPHGRGPEKMLSKRREQKIKDLYFSIGETSSENPKDKK